MYELEEDRTICQNFMKKERFQANLVLKKPLGPGTAIGRSTGNRGCETGIGLGTIKGWGTFAIIGGVMHSCSA